MEAKINLGAPQDVEKWSKNFSGGPPAGTSAFCFAPGGPQERSGADLYSARVASWQPPGARGVPGGLRELILIVFASFGDLFVCNFWSHFGICFGTFRGGRTAATAAEAAAKAAEAAEQNSSESSRSSIETSRSILSHSLDPHPHSFVSLSLPACPATPATTASQVLRVGGCPR